MDPPTVPPYRFIPPPPLPLPPSSPPTPPPSSHQDWIIVLFLLVAFAVSLLWFSVCAVLERHRENRGRAEAATAPPPPALLSRAPPRLEPSRHFEELRLRQARDANPAAARLPAFKYNRSVNHNMTGEGEETATCSVCLKAFQFGETVRLLPACLHLYHVECIDPWLDTHSTCPMCRSDTDPTMDVVRLPPV